MSTTRQTAEGRDATRITVLIPAHNEEDRVGAALQSLERQSRPADRVVVIADNCTDNTVSIARQRGADVVETIGNTDKKAGALNQTLEWLLPSMGRHDLVLVMDADSTIVPSFLAVATETLGGDPQIGAVGGIFLGEPGGGLLGELQRNEYARYQRQIARRGDDALVLTGTATLHRVDVLNRLLERRGQVYDTSALTEDNEITLAIKSMGLRCVSPRECIVVTEVMPTWSDLWKQRLRWQRGALENLRTYGLTRVTRPYAVQQAGMAFGVFAMWLYLVYTCYIIATGQFGVHPIWTTLGLVFVGERVVTVWHRGRKARLLAAVLIVEWVYDLFLQGVLMRSALDVALRRPATWHHVGAATA
ncbi:glycosyltransferase family 2 protein [Phytoactinopolyspora alkaliphila]|uniref:Glycosyltransferase family 2 protein n=1 Tax=Phytoactinopolyspora alkaliphila TaxID=1783498 RepID=A0A6N9YMH4_9ACTN|nr:glycosyltransferase family 2 protein [Phytoactinopolyspora alkaliphila]NED96059.1 glycosyltransferase family 2 protein [Phytoactinopolyspora alkaliphila]